VIADPGGDLAAYERMTREMLESGVRHIVGAITSWSRKEMIPLLERHGGLSLRHFGRKTAYSNALIIVWNSAFSR